MFDKGGRFAVDVRGMPGAPAAAYSANRPPLVIIQSPNPSGVRYNGDWEIWVQKLDVKKMRLTGPAPKVWKGSQRGAIWPEGRFITFTRNDKSYVQVIKRVGEKTKYSKWPPEM